MNLHTDSQVTQLKNQCLADREVISQCSTLSTFDHGLLYRSIQYIDHYRSFGICALPRFLGIFVSSRLRHFETIPGHSKVVIELCMWAHAIVQYGGHSDSFSVGYCCTLLFECGEKQDARLDGFRNGFPYLYPLQTSTFSMEQPGLIH